MADEANTAPSGAKSTLIIDFQLEENRWAAQMACDEATAVSAGMFSWNIGHVRQAHPSIYALAVRILRTETPPVDPLLLRAREIVADYYEKVGGISTIAKTIREGKGDHYAELKICLATLKKGRGR